MEIKIVNRSKHPLPEYKTKASAGMDIRANLEEIVTLKPLERKLIPTGLFIELPEGYEAQIRPRSGLALNEGLGLLNSPGGKPIGKSEKTKISTSKQTHVCSQFPQCRRNSSQSKEYIFLHFPSLHLGVN